MTRAASPRRVVALSLQPCQEQQQQSSPSPWRAVSPALGDAQVALQRLRSDTSQGSIIEAKKALAGVSQRRPLLCSPLQLCLSPSL